MTTGTYKDHDGIIALEPSVFDWRVGLDMSIRDFARGANEIAEALNAGGEKAAYIRANARQFGEPLPLQLVCSIWLAMEQLEAAE
jgi:hypothetical protein